MDISVATTGAKPAPALPTIKPDQRPAADAAAIARDATPYVPLPIPAGFAPIAAVNQSRIAHSPGNVVSVERTLKPYGVTMLPRGPVEDAVATARTGGQNGRTVRPEVP